MAISPIYIDLKVFPQCECGMMKSDKNSELNDYIELHVKMSIIIIYFHIIYAELPYTPAYSITVCVQIFTGLYFHKF